MFYPSKIIVLGHEELGISNGGSSFNLVIKVFVEQHIIDARQSEMMNNQGVNYRS
jgi:hypothetical protein